jgi:hypothetical protein
LGEKLVERSDKSFGERVGEKLVEKLGERLDSISFLAFQNSMRMVFTVLSLAYGLIYGINIKGCSF